MSWLISECQNVTSFKVKRVPQHAKLKALALFDKLCQLYTDLVRSSRIMENPLKKLKGNMKHLLQQPRLG